MDLGAVLVAGGSDRSQVVRLNDATDVDGLLGRWRATTERLSAAG